MMMMMMMMMMRPISKKSPRQRTTVSGPISSLHAQDVGDDDIAKHASRCSGPMTDARYLPFRTATCVPAPRATC
eukprot:12427419-Karenia_brevis.AAC.1